MSPSAHVAFRSCRLPLMSPSAHVAFRSCRLPLMSPSAHVAFRSCRLPLMSPSAHVAFRSCRLPLMSPSAPNALVKALGALCPLALILLPLPSWAGQWEAVPSGTSTTTGTQNGTTATNIYTYTDGGYGPRPLPYYLGGGGGSANSRFPAPASEDTTANITITLTWVPDPGMTLATDPPPTAPVILNEYQYAAWNASASLNYGDPTLGLSIAGSTSSDGYGDAQIFDIYNPANYWGYSSGNHLIQVDGSSGTITLTPGMMHMYASMDCSGVPPQDGSPLAGAATYLEISIAPDHRAVSISADCDTTNMKAPAYNPDGSIQYDAYKNMIYTPVPHTPTADGTMYGDMGLGWGVIGGSVTSLYSKTNFTSHLAGTWGASSTYNWFSSLKNSGGGGPTFGNTYSTAATNDDTDPATIDPGDTGKVDHIHLTVTDSNDGAQGTANYYLALHQPDEFLPSKQATEPITYNVLTVEAASPGWAVPGIGVNCTWNTPGAYWDYLSGGADAMAEIPGVDESFPWFGLFCATAGIAIDHLKPLPCTGPVSFDPQEAGSDYPDETLHPFATTDHTYFIMIPHFHELYTRTHLLHDTWNTTGFVSETPINSDVFVRVSGSYGTYKYQVTLPAVK